MQNGQFAGRIRDAFGESPQGGASAQARPAASPGGDVVAKLQQLTQLKESGALTEEEAQVLVQDLPELSLAAVNSPTACTLSGPTEALAQLRERLHREGVEHRPLRTLHAFHSHMSEPILERFTDEVRRVALRPPEVSYLSNVTGTWITAAEARDPRYWARHTREAVRFDRGVAELLQAPGRVLVGSGDAEAWYAVSSVSTTEAEGAALSPAVSPAAGASDAAVAIRVESFSFLFGFTGRTDLAGIAAGLDNATLGANGLPNAHPEWALRTPNVLMTLLAMFVVGVALYSSVTRARTESGQATSVSSAPMNSSGGVSPSSRCSQKRSMVSTPSRRNRSS